MSKIITEERNGIVCRYFNSKDNEGRNVRVYLLPNVPMDTGNIPTQPDSDSETLESTISEYFPEQREKVRKISEQYRGRQIDALSVLLYAKEMGKFSEFAQKLEDKPKDFEYIHPDLMYARTDVTAFFVELYAELGKAPRERAIEAKQLVSDCGPAIVVYPNNA
ncbi:MAG: hypothetical protein HZB67_00590 [Candidatus Aenigmarchaeota archaeon]|nr:hypothetical protein [Candidatus Aenigmarchaeota archaeon]